MSLALTTVTNGNVISVTDLRTYVGLVEDYVNQGIAAADLLATSWVESTHIFGGQFYGSPNPRARFETGQTVYRHTGMDPLRERVFHNRYNSAGAYVDGLCATFAVPETLNQGTGDKYDLLVEASFWCYTFGGINGVIDDTELAANFRFRLDDDTKGPTRRNLYTGDAVAATPYNGGIIYARKNHHMVYRIAAASMGVGLHNIGVVVDVATNNNTRHIIVGGRTLRASWYVR
jgi:hypothetical protein